MKFYYCEVCGKRLTEHDIDGGVAKDKKLKGVYCRSCAVGVSTMDTLPLTDSQAQEMVERDRAAQKSQLGSAKQKRSSGGIRRVSARGSGAHRRGTSSARIPAGRSDGGGQLSPSSSSKGMLVMGFTAVLGSAIMVGLVLWISGSEKKPRSSARINERKKVEPTQKPEPSRAATTGTSDAAPAQKPDQKPGVEPDPLQANSSEPADRPEPGSPSAEPLPEKKVASAVDEPKTPDPAPAPEKKATDPEPIQKSPAPEPTPPQESKAEIEKKAEAERQAALKILGALLQEIAPLLKERKFSKAISLIDRRRRAPDAAKAAPYFERTRGHIEGMQAAQRRAIQNLGAKANEEVRVWMGRAEFTGKVKKATEDTVDLILSGNMAMTLRAEKLDLRDVARYGFAKAEKAEPRDRLVLGLLRLFSGQAEIAEKTLKELKGEGLEEDVGPYIALAEAGRKKEAALKARAAWEKAESLCQRRRWKEARRALQDLESRFGEALPKDIGEKVKARLATLAARLGPSSSAGWPSGMGPTGQRASAETGIPNTFPTSGLKLAWKTELKVASARERRMGNGSVVGAKGRLYMVASGEKLICLDLKTGTTVWTMPMGGGAANGTPLIGPSLNRIYVTNSHHEATVVRGWCVDARSGRPIWKVDTRKLGLGSIRSKGSSFWIHGPLAILSSAQKVLALNKNTGQVVWAWPGAGGTEKVDSAGNAETSIRSISGGSPVLAGTPERPVIIKTLRKKPHAWRDCQVALDLKTGREVGGSDGIGGGTPILANSVLVADIPPTPEQDDDLRARRGLGGFRVGWKDDRFEFHEQWRMKMGRWCYNRGSGLALAKGRVYKIGSSVPLTCMDLATGKVFWRLAPPEEWGASGTILWADGKIIALNSAGMLWISLDAGTKAHSLMTQKLSNGTRGGLALVDGMLVLRDNDYMYAYELKSDAAKR